ncbi:MAG: ATP-grasp domain-containing protein [Deltaproteobacteria bacterium]|nr:ATP-grasp domain-containing protein [Deltaproteobacteria bacterium]
MKTSTLLLVGYRTKAVLAAKELGFNIILWDEKKPPRKKRILFKKIFTLPLYETKLPKKFAYQLKQEKINLVSGVTEKSVIPSVFARQALQLPGTPLKVANRCRNKIVMKTFAAKKNIKVTPFMALRKNTNIKTLERKLSYPIVLKYKDRSGRRGLLIARNKKKLRVMMHKRDLAERLITGKEFSIESLIYNGKIIFKNITEYYDLYTINIVPAGLAPKQHKLINKLNEDIIKKFKIKQGMTHLECYLTKEGFIFGEIALRPPGGYLMDLIKIAYHFDPWLALLSIESGKPLTPPQKAKNAAASWLLHPGSGKIKTIQGVKEIKKIKEISAFKIKMKEGDIIQKRKGTSDEYGHFFIKALNRKKILNTIKTIKHKFHIVKE